MSAIFKCFLFQLDLDEEYDIVQKIGEGWFSRVYLTEHRQTRQELVLKVGQVTNQSRCYLQLYGGNTF